jgi:hypothetical protein
MHSRGRLRGGREQEELKLVEPEAARGRPGKPRQAPYDCCIGVPISTPQSGVAGV